MEDKDIIIITGNPKNDHAITLPNTGFKFA